MSVLSSLAADLRDQAQRLRAAADALSSQAATVDWSRAAADAMRRRAIRGAADLRHAADLHDRAADAVARHVAAIAAPVSEVEHLIRGLL